MEKFLNNDSLTIKDMLPKQHIEAISKDYLDASERILKTVSGALDRLGKAFSRRGHFVMEFIQNADDAQAKQVKFEISNNSIRISNSGKSFIAKDVDSICSAGQSSKPIEDYIGYLGVGFKSVFLISNSPEIHSGSYHFKFDKNHWQDAGKLPWQVVPIWIDKTETEKADTIFEVPLKHSDMAGTIRKEISRESL